MQYRKLASLAVLCLAAGMAHAQEATIRKNLGERLPKLPKIDDTCDVCGGHDFKRRPDDNEATVRTRMAEYRAKTAPILPYYDERGLVRRVDGMQLIGTVTAEIDAILDRA